ncbi:MAG: glycosyltransferase family 2 protein [Acidobacteriota bacterium]
MISVIVPIKNEPPEAALPLARFSAPPDCELVVVNASEGSPAEFPGARLILEKGSRGACLARAASEARGEILFFLHADSRPPQDALAIIQRAVGQGAAAGAFSLAYENADRRMRWIAWWANLRSRFLRIPFGDQGIFCRRDAYDAAGGFRDMPVCDDIDLVRRLRAVGRFVIRPEITTTSSRRYRDSGALRQVLRVWVVMGGYFLGISPKRLGRWYYGTAS